MRLGITSPIRQAAVEAGREHISERVLEDRSELLPILAPELERGAAVVVELRFNRARVRYRCGSRPLSAKVHHLLRCDGRHLSEMTVKQQLVLADRLIALALGLGCFRYQSVKSISGCRVHYGAR